MPNLYQDYFNIDPKYYAAVTADLIQQGKVSWKNFYPHETFVKLLETTYKVLSGSGTRSVWVEGAYGTGKSHAALTVKSLVDASVEEVIAYFNEYGLSPDLRDKYVSLKAGGTILTIHRIGSAGIHTDMDLVLAVQQSIMAALREHGIQNQGDASMRDAFLQWVDKKANRDYFAALIDEERYFKTFYGESVERVIEKLTSGDDAMVEITMAKVMTVLKENGQYGIFSDVNQMAGWIRSVIHENHLAGILFVWDEFSEYFLTHPVGLTGFQTLAEISQSDPFYFMIVAHESKGLFADKDTANKTLDRFESAVRIELPENMAFQLMAQAMKKTDDPVLAKKWLKYKQTLNDDLVDVRSMIYTASKRNSKLGKKTVLSDKEMQEIVPIHPYAALVLKNIAVLFNSNQRSMFDFIISDDMTDARGFKWFINNYGPFSDPNLLTVDLLWDFFYGKGQSGLNDDVRGILDNYDMLQGGKLLTEEQRVLKTILLLQAVSLRVTGNDLLVPDDQNLDLSFLGTDWNKGRALAIANGLIEKKFLFKKPIAGGKSEYCVASKGDSSDVNEIRKQVIKETKIQGLLVTADMGSAIVPANAVKARYLMDVTGYGAFNAAVSSMKAQQKPERFKVIVTFALNDTEAAQVKQQILKQVNMPGNEMLFIETLSPMGKDLLDQYVEAMTFSRYNTKRNDTQARYYEQQANNVLNDWKQKIISGSFNIYTPENKSGIRVANFAELQDSLTQYNHKKYYWGLEQYQLNGTMYTLYQLANGAQFGIEERLSGAYSNKNKKMSLEHALEGAWKIPEYWKDPGKQSLPIVHFKKKVDEIVQEGFRSAQNRASLLTLVEELEKPPFGLMPSALAAFVLGFTLKEYANSNYFWSNGSNTETMTVDKMKVAIANALNQRVNPIAKYKEEAIVTIGSEVRKFLTCTSRVFRLPTLGSVESARDQIRVRMKGLTFPIWCLKYLLPQMELESSEELVRQVIDGYTGIANTANLEGGSESERAGRIGQIVLEHPEIEVDLERLLTGDQCRKGMLAYIEVFRNGILKQLAEQIGDGGKYLDEVKGKFSASDANWVWNTATADEKISAVILEYQIIVESNKSLGRYTTLKEVVNAWNSRTNQIHIPCQAVEKATGDLGPFLRQLYTMKKNGSISEQDKQRFYDLLLTQREAFDDFYQNQFPYFERDTDAFLENLDKEERVELFNSFPSGQFTKDKTEYYRFVRDEVNRYLQSRVKKQLRDKWYEMTHTKTPVDWSEKYETPILCMFNDSERSTARKMLKIIQSANPGEGDAKQALQWMDQTDIYDRLEDAAERDRCFMERIVGDNRVLLNNAKRIRSDLLSKVHERIYDWMDNSAVQNQLAKMAEKEYKLSGSDKAMAIIDQMDTEQLRKYLRERIQDDAAFGMQILKGEG